MPVRCAGKREMPDSLSTSPSKVHLHVTIQEATAAIWQENSSSLLLETQEICVFSRKGCRFGATGEAGIVVRLSFVFRLDDFSRPLSLANPSAFCPSLYSASVDPCMPRTSYNVALEGFPRLGNSTGAVAVLSPRTGV